MQRDGIPHLAVGLNTRGLELVIECATEKYGREVVEYVVATTLDRVREEKRAARRLRDITEDVAWERNRTEEIRGAAA